MTEPQSQARGPARWRNRLLRGTLHHYSLFFPRRPGRLISWLLRLFYSGISLDKRQGDKVRALPESAIIVYVSKYKSRFEHLFYHTRYGQLGLPVPELSFDHRILLLQPLSRLVRIAVAAGDHLLRRMTSAKPFENGYAAECLQTGCAAHLALVRRRGFYKRFIKAGMDPLHFLVQLQRDVQRPIFIVPQLMFFGRNPASQVPSLVDLLFGSELRPGLLRRVVTMFKNPERVFVEISEPLDLQGFLGQPELADRGVDYQALVLRRELLRQINRHRQTIIGPVLKSRQELKESILTGDRMAAYLNAYAAQKAMPIYKVRRKADGYLEEIAARYSFALLNVFSAVVRFLFNTMFDGISVNHEALQRVKESARRGPLILVPCHKSHIDYLLLSYLLFQTNMPCPLVAAGKNLSFFPLGPLFRNSGAFFIRRTFKGKPLYARVFSEYIYKILQEGFNIEFFIEGGRSRTGKMILPKMGLLSTLIKSYQQGACEDLVFVPIFIGYDRVLEESAYLKEMEGGAKEPENLSQVIRARRFLKKRYGRVYVRFQEPFSFKALLAQNDIDMDRLSPAEQAALSRNVAFRVINAINAVTIVTPHALVAGAALNLPLRRFAYEDLVGAVEGYLTYLYALQAPLADTLVMDQTRAIEQAIEAYLQRRFIEPIAGGKQTPDEDRFYAVSENKRPNLEYYKNNAIHFFVPAAATALAILERDAFQFASADLHVTYRSLQQLFKNEFAYDIDRQPEYYVRKSIKAFIDDAILMPHPTLPDTYNLTSAGYRKLKLFAAFLKTYLESYWIVISHFRVAAGQPMEAKERLKKIEALGSRMFKGGEIERKEALSRINYKNGVDFFISRGIGQPGDEPTLAPLAADIRRCLDILAG
jgi:glycerol-3-phosphate O-acyltransferase